MAGLSTRQLQEALNAFTNRYVDGVAPLRVDGADGPATRKRVRQAKYWLGYDGKPNSADSTAFRERLWHPKEPKYSTRERIARGEKRRTDHRAAWRVELRRARASGVATFDGVPVALVGVPHLEWAREHGWQGVLVSGWRSPEHSDDLCHQMCGAPSCPGKCAGRASNHSGKTMDRFALDVSDYQRFGRLMATCPHSPRLSNALGQRDPVHFSPSGR